MLFLHFLVCFHFNRLILRIFCRKNQSPKSLKIVKYGIFHVFLPYFDQNSDSRLNYFILIFFQLNLMSNNWYFIKKNSFELSSFPFKGCSQPLKRFFYLLYCFFSISESNSWKNLNSQAQVHLRVSHFQCNKNFLLHPFTTGDPACENKLLRKALSLIDIAKKG